MQNKDVPSKKLQQDPPEGSRKVIEHELERQDGQQAGNKDKPQDRTGRS